MYEHLSNGTSEARVFSVFSEIKVVVYVFLKINVLSYRLHDQAKHPI